MKALAIDIGGSHATCAVVQDRAILSSETVPLDGTQCLGPALPLLARSLRHLAASAGVPLSGCGGVAFGFCGLVNSYENRITSTNMKFEDAPSLDLIGWSQREFGLPLRVENDARMALLGEWYAGSAQDVDDAVMFTLGTGIGGVAMMNGKLLRGKHYQAGCLAGHFPALFSGRRCTCGAVGCAEAEAAGWSLPLVCREWPGFAESALAREERIDFEALFRLASQQDAVAQAVRDRCLQIWAVNSVAAIYAFDPELIIFGGGVMRSGDLILPFIQSYIDQHAWTPWGRVQVRPAKLGNEAALLAAIPLLAESSPGQAA